MTKPNQQLNWLNTPLGKRSLTESVVFCNRCNACAQSCPIYVHTSKELYSPRGRNQLMRLIQEGKLKPKENKDLIYAAVSSCLFCGNCAASCAGKIPTAEHMVALRRQLNIRLLPRLLQRFLSWRSSRPALFNYSISFFNFLRNVSIVTLLRWLGFFNLPSLRFVKHADDILPIKITFLQKQLQKEQINYTPEKPDLIYLPSLEAAYFNPVLGRDALKWLEHQKPFILFKQASGLFEYMYGDLRAAKKTARELIKRYEEIGGGAPLPLLTDSAEAYYFLKNYEQLFSGNRRWEEKARKFSANILFLTDLSFPPKLSYQNRRTALERGGLFSNENQAYVRARETLQTHLKKNFVECVYREGAAPPAAYGFVQGTLAPQLMLNRIQDSALNQTELIVCLSGLAALELQYYLSRYYPQAKAAHFVQLRG